MFFLYEQIRLSKSHIHINTDWDAMFGVWCLVAREVSCRKYDTVLKKYIVYWRERERNPKIIVAIKIKFYFLIGKQSLEIYYSLILEDR